MTSCRFEAKMHEDVVSMRISWEPGSPVNSHPVLNWEPDRLKLNTLELGLVTIKIVVRSAKHYPRGKMIDKWS